MFKRLFSVILSVIMLISLCPFQSSVDAGQPRGDANNDGVLSAIDYALVKRSVLGTYTLTPEMLAAADINGDGKLTAYDYALIKRSVLGTYTISEINNSLPVSFGKQYTLSIEPGSNYPDTFNCELTDSLNSVSTSYTSTSFVGFNASVDITVDLENDGKFLNAFEISYLDINTAGVYRPKSVSVLGSNDNDSWDEIGVFALPEYKNDKVTKVRLELEKEINFRYIKFSVEKSAYWVFIDEVYVYANIIDASEYELSGIKNAYNADKLTDQERLANAAAAFNGNIYNSENGRIVISSNCSYQIECSGYDWRAGANSKLLTDASCTGSGFNNPSWVGVSVSESASVTVDLGAVQEDVCGFALHTFKRSTVNIEYPDYVDVEVSADGNNYYCVGRMYAITANQENYAFSLFLNNLISARYIRFSLATGSGYCWIEELEVFGNRSIGNIAAGEKVYGDFDFTPATESVYWDRSFDYSFTRVLSKGASYQIICDADIDLATYGESNTTEESGLLTDGVTTDDINCYNGYWNHFLAGAGRTVVIDIGKISSISSCNVRFLNRTSWGITLPSGVKFALSENGTDWYLAESKNGITGADDAVVEVNSSFADSYRARYVLVAFPLDIHVFVDEITVKGKKNYNSGTSLAESTLDKYNFTAVNTEKPGYPERSESYLGGANDISLVYHNGSKPTDEAYFLPYVAYLDKNGSIKDTMFDGYLFLPSTGELPSGGRPYGTNIASDWEYLYNDLFAADRCFAALDRTAETTKTALGLSELKLKVYATIPHMDDTLADFGDIDGDGISENLTLMETRVYVAKYYAEKIIAAFEAAGYENLELCGFYWFHESISGGDIETSKQVNAAFDELGYPMFWIPYYQASGFSNWAEFGFDAACLQPNYAFSLSVDKSRLETATELAKAYGMSIEIEIDAAAVSDIRYYKKYMDYLSAGVEFGYMTETVHMYYQGYDTFAVACKSDSELIRNIYDRTYEFIKGTLDVMPLNAADISFSASKNTALEGSVSAVGDGAVYYVLERSTEHGSVTLADDGTFTYYPNKGFTGTDTFKYRINNYLGVSEECVVNITVD